MTDSCSVCGRSVGDTAYLCPACTDKLRAALLDLEAYGGELHVTITRQDRISIGLGAPVQLADRSDVWEDTPFDTIKQLWKETAGAVEQALPFHLGASNQRRLVEAALTWARHVSETRGRDIPEPARWLGPICEACDHDGCRWWRNWTADPEPAAFRWLIGELDWIRHQREAGEMFRDITAAAPAVRRAVDAQEDRVYVGPCGAATPAGRCSCDLYAREGEVFVTCQACGHSHDVAKRQWWLLERANDQLAHAALLSKALAKLGEGVTEVMISRWVAKGRLFARGQVLVGGKWRPTYRVGDVRRLAEDEAARKAG